MVREITYKVAKDTKSIVPATKQWAGMQYEDNATTVTFDLTELITNNVLDTTNKKYAYRIDFNSSSAGYQPSENIQFNGRTLSRTLPLSLTQYGGEVQITAVITELDDNDNATGVCYSYPVTVWFTAVNKDAFSESKVVENISAMEEEIKGFVEEKETDIGNTIDAAKSEISDAKNEIVEVSEQATADLATAVNEAKNDIDQYADNANTNLQNGIDEFQSYVSNQYVNIDNSVAQAKEAAQDSAAAAGEALQSETAASKSAENAETAYQETLALKEEIIASAPKIYTGTDISVEAIAKDGTVTITVSENDVLYSAKVGDIYINQYVFKCIRKNETDNKQYWSCLDYSEASFDPESEIAQSGKAVAEAKEAAITEAKQYTDSAAPKIYSGTKVSSPGASTGAIVTATSSNNPELLNVKSGDLYINTDEGNIYYCKEATVTSQPDMNVSQWQCVEHVGNKVTNLFVSSEDLTHDQYPSAKATSEFVNSLGSSLSGDVQALDGKITSIGNSLVDKEDKENKAKDYDSLQGDSTDQYPSTYAMMQKLNSLAEGMRSEFQPKIDTLDSNKVDKEDGKSLYRGMEVIYEHTITEGEAGAHWGWIDTDMDGNSFELDEIYFYISAPSTFAEQTGNTYITLNNDTAVANYWFTVVNKADTKTMQAYGKRVKENHWCNMVGQMANSLYSSQFYGSYRMPAIDYVTSFKLGGMALYPAGTQILFCGRRVD